MKSVGKIGSISFFSSSDTETFHHLLGFNAIGINSSFIISVRIIFIKIIEIDIIMIYTKNIHFITRIFIKKSKISSVYKSVWSFLIILHVTNQSGMLLLENHQQVHYTFFEFYTYQGNILFKKNIKEQIFYFFLEFYIDQE